MSIANYAIDLNVESNVKVNHENIPLGHQVNQGHKSKSSDKKHIKSSLVNGII